MTTAQLIPQVSKLMDDRSIADLAMTNEPGSIMAKAAVVAAARGEIGNAVQMGLAAAKEWATANNHERMDAVKHFVQSNVDGMRADFEKVTGATTLVA